MLMSASPHSPAFEQPGPPYSHHHPHAHLHAYNPYPRPAGIKREASNSPQASLASSNPDLWPLKIYDAPSHANGTLITPVDGPTRPASPASTASSSSLVLFPTTGGDADGGRPHSSASLHTYAKPQPSLFTLPEDGEGADISPVHPHVDFNADDGSSSWPARREQSTIRRRSSKGSCCFSSVYIVSDAFMRV
jgi:hypothetical protein